MEKSRLLEDTGYSILSHYAAHMTWKSGTRYFDSYLRLAKAAYLSELLLDELNAEGDAEEIAYYTSAEVFFLYAPRKMHKRGGERRASRQIDRYASVLYE